MNKKIIVSAILLLSGFNAFAQSTFPGLNYPQPTTTQVSKSVTPSFEDLKSNKITKSAEKRKSDEISEIRKQGLEEVASALGASSGLTFRMKEIRADVERNAARLDALFDFRTVIFSNGVLAPVLKEGKANYSQLNDDEVMTADIIYKITQPAKFTPVYPTWRTYLKFDFPAFEPPSDAYLPKNETENAIWDNALKQGWEAGIKQADNIFRTSYNNLEADYMGMLKFHILLAQGLVTAPMLAKANLGITGGGNEMAINNQIFRIVDHSGLDPHKEDWKTNYPVSDYKDINKKDN